MSIPVNLAVLLSRPKPLSEDDKRQFRAEQFCTMAVAKRLPVVKRVLRTLGA